MRVYVRLLFYVGTIFLWGALPGNYFLMGCPAWELFSYGVPCVGTIFLRGKHFLMGCPAWEFFFSWGALRGNYFLMGCPAW